MSFFEKFGRSAAELKSIRCITVTAVLIALDIVIKSISITIPLQVGGNMKITFAFLALATIGMLYGPTVSFLAGILTDIIGYFIHPDGGFSPLFTVVEAVGGLIYGIFLYKLRPLGKISHENNKQNFLSILRIVLSKVVVVILCNLIMTPVAMVLSGYSSFEAQIATMPLKLIKNGIQCPVDCILMIIIMFPILAAYNKVFPKTYKKIAAEKNN